MCDGLHVILAVASKAANQVQELVGTTGPLDAWVGLLKTVATMHPRCIEKPAQKEPVGGPMGGGGGMLLTGRHT